jgi:hypothetical protein
VRRNEERMNVPSVKTRQDRLIAMSAEAIQQEHRVSLYAMSLP